MGRVCLTPKELEPFPTLAELIEKMGHSNEHAWGLCGNDEGKIVFTEESGIWKLIFSLHNINVNAQYEFGGNYNPEEIKFVYSVEFYPGEDPDIDYNLFDISSCEIKPGETPMLWEIQQN